MEIQIGNETFKVQNAGAKFRLAILGVEWTDELVDRLHAIPNVDETGMEPWGFYVQFNVSLSEMVNLSECESRAVFAVAAAIRETLICDSAIVLIDDGTVQGIDKSPNS